MAREPKDLAESKYTERLDGERERAYAAQMAVYAQATMTLPQRNSASSRPASRFAAGPPGGRGSLIVDEAFALTSSAGLDRRLGRRWNPKGRYDGPPVDPTHPGSLYGTLSVDRCLADPAAITDPSRFNGIGFYPPTPYRPRPEPTVGHVIRDTWTGRIIARIMNPIEFPYRH